MTNVTALTNITAPAGPLGPSTTTSTPTTAVGSGRVTLGPLMRPMKGAWPAPDATNGPLLSDSGLVSGAPSTSGKTFYPWDSGVYNTQSQNWAQFPNGSLQNNTGTSVCANYSTARAYTLGPSIGLPVESNTDFGFVTDATTVTIYYFHYTYNVGRNYHDQQIYVEHDGVMKKVTTMPTTGSVAAGLCSRTLTFKEAREREFRVMLGWTSLFAGVYVESTATMRQSPNKPLIITNGDSWNEPTGNILATPIGGAYPTGTYENAGLSQMLAEATGFAVALCAEGATGYFNGADGASHTESYVNSTWPGINNSVFLSERRVAAMAAKFFPRNPILCNIGGWNDGDLPPTPVRTTYAARVSSGIARAIAAKPDLQMLFVGVQPVDITAGGKRALANLAIADAVAAAPQANIVGFIDEMPMWVDTTMSGQRGANVNSSDHIHLTCKGAELVANWFVASMKNLSIPADYYAGMLAYQS